MASTKMQAECVQNTFGVATAVVAGAGSGKTYTLTERVVYALSHPEESGVSSIDDIVAITYTNAAAGELRARIRARLQELATPENGLAEQALRVDDAWISTIHSMCKRILTENAFTFGIDPNFSIMEPSLAGVFLEAAIEVALKDPGSPELASQVKELFSEYGVDRTKSMIKKLADEASESGGRLEDLFVLPPRIDRVETLLEIALCAEELASKILSRKAPTPPQEAYVDELQEAIRAVTGASPDEPASLQHLSTERKHELSAMDERDILRLAAGFKNPRGSMTEAKEPLDRTGLTPKHSFARAAYDLLLEYGRPQLLGLIALAQRSLDIFAVAKRAEGMLDHGDLLTLVYQLLSDPKNADIRARLNDRFKLIMVDEFQDTNQMQVDMIDLLAGASDGKPSEKLCVVGDAQQSIYRFRNADLAVFRNHIAKIDGTPGARRISLGDNFRSHSDILALSKGIFSQVFDDEYLDLLHGRDEDSIAASAPYHGASPGEDASIPRRVNIKFFSKECISKDRMSVAREIASDLKLLVDRGNRPGEMTILLGAMTHADNYARALQEVGLKCAITGGSVFRDTKEVQIIESLCFAIPAMEDAANLIAILTSDLFALQASDLLRLKLFDGERKRLSWLFGQWADEATREGMMASLEDATPYLKQALWVLSRAAVQVGRRRISSIVKDVLVGSGWLDRLGDQGLERAANAFKAIDMIRSLEDSTGLTGLQLARRFSEVLAGSKEAPGVLSTKGDDFVKIMTIHGSKGLSLPIVAVAEANYDYWDRDRLKTISANGKVHVSLRRNLPSDGSCDSGIMSDPRKHHLRPAVSFEALEACAHPSDHAALIAALDEQGEFEEHQRKMYVALTRAKEALILTMAAPGESKEARDHHGSAIVNLMGLADEEGLIKAKGHHRRLVDLHTTYEDDPSYDVSWQARVESFPLDVIEAASEEGEDTDEATDAQDGQDPEELVEPYGGGEEFIVPLQTPADPPSCVPSRLFWSEGILSASALAHHDAPEDASDETDGDAPVDHGSAPLMALESEDEWDVDDAPATERGTAFHSLCEWGVIHREPGGPFALPPQDRIDATARYFGLSDRQRDGLAGALSHWLESSAARRAMALTQAKPEYPFWVQLAPANPQEGRRPLVLQGFIDLLGYDTFGKGTAYVVDYKTGTRYDTDEKRRAAYGVQAATYAYALLMKGFDSVELDFVFVDQQDEGSASAASITHFPAEGSDPYTLDSARSMLLDALDEQ